MSIKVGLLVTGDGGTVLPIMYFYGAVMAISISLITLQSTIVERDCLLTQKLLEMRRVAVLEQRPRNLFLNMCNGRLRFCHGKIDK
jgi:hypothetical protein